ncbi:MAG: ABC transporter permease [Christensenellaceae bacterium]
MEKTLKNRFSKQSKLTLIMLAILGILIIVIYLVQTIFLNSSNIRNIITQQSILVIVGVSITFLMITGNFDLSIGSIIGASGVMCAWFCQPASYGGLGLPFAIAVILASFVGLLIGALNALLVVKLGMASVVATLGTMSIARGLAYIFANGSMIEVGLPPEFRIFGQVEIAEFFTIPVITMIVLVLVFMFIQNKTVFGRQIFYIGANRKAAELSGVKVNKRISTLFMMSGLIAGFAGVLLASKLGAGDCKVGVGYEFDTVVAVVLGGTSMQGGSGSVIGMVIGVFIIGVLQNALNLFAAAPEWQVIVKGIVIIAAILLQRAAINKMNK